MRKALREKRSVTAILASLLFVVQMLMASWAMAGMAGQFTVDAFGNPLCITNVDGEPASSTPQSPGKDHGSLPACCTLGCAATSSALPSADLASDILFFAPTPVATLFVARTDGAHAGRGHTPGNPRAPPLKD